VSRLTDGRIATELAIFSAAVTVSSTSSTIYGGSDREQGNQDDVVATIAWSLGGDFGLFRAGIKKPLPFGSGCS